MIRVFVALLLFALISLAQAQELQKNEITIFNKQGENYRFIVDVAEAEEDKARGLMYRKTWLPTRECCFCTKENHHS